MMTPSIPKTNMASSVLIGASVILAAAIFLFDLSMADTVAAGLPYLALLLLGYFAPWWYYIYLMAGLATVFIIIGYFISPATGEVMTSLANRGLTLMAIWALAVFLTRVRSNYIKFQTLVDSTSDGIIFINHDGIINLFNKGAEDIFGYSFKEIIGQNVSILMPSPHRENHDDYISRYLNTHEAKVLGKRNELKALRKDGTVFPIELTVNESYLGENLGFIGIVRDITAHAKAEERVNILSRAIEQSPVSIIITDTKGTIQYVNPKFTQVSGYAYTEVIGKNTRILRSGETPAGEYKNLWQTILTGGEWRGVFHNVKKNGELFWESASISPVKNTEGHITHFLAVKEDITEQLETEKQLTHALKLEATGQLTSGIAHDFNNLLTIITGNLQLLMEDKNAIDGKEIKAILNDVLSAAHDGEELIRRLLLLLRKNKPQSNRIEVNGIIAELKKVLDRMLGEDIKVSINLSEAVTHITVFADPNQLECALLNLAVNSRDAMPNGGNFIIETARVDSNFNSSTELPDLAPGNYIAITVRDTGTGMDEGTIARAFEPFFTTKEAGKGSGLGLSMVYNFARQAGGDLLLDSVPGQGTTVTIYLAESTAPIEDEQLPERLERVPRGRETILVVEDNNNVRRFAVRGLENLGYRVLETDNSDTAMELLNTGLHAIDLLFSDIIIPGGKNGYELAQWSIQHHPSLKILLTSGHRAEMFEHASHNGEDLPLLKKPYSLEKLAQSIRSQLDSSVIHH